MSIYILVGFVIVFSEIITYKIIKKIDKKERKKLYNWELKYVENIKKIKQEEYEYIKKTKELKDKNSDTTANEDSDDQTKEVKIERSDCE